MMELEQVQKFHDQNDLSKDPKILLRYRQASSIVSAAMYELSKMIRKGADISDLCKRSDAFLREKCKELSLAEHCECGIALPTTLCPEEWICNYAPVESVFLNGDDAKVVKAEFAVHVDGYISSVAHSFAVMKEEEKQNSNCLSPLQGRCADAFVAVHLASKAVERILKEEPGCKSERIFIIINSIARMFGCLPVEGVVSQQLKRYLLDGEKIIIGARDNSIEGGIVPSFILEAGDVICVNLAFCIGGESKALKREDCTTIYNRDVMKDKSRLKLQSSKMLIERIDQEFGVFPFSLGMLNSLIDDGPKAKLGLAECVSCGLLRVNPPLATRKPNIVVQSKFTCIVGHGRITEEFPFPKAHSQFVIQDPEIKVLIQ